MSYSKKEDLVKYITDTLFDAANQAYKEHDRIDTFGVVFETFDERAREDHDPAPRVIGACPDDRATMYAIRKAAADGKAQGALYVAQDGRDVTLTFEHKTHGVMAWKARTTLGELGDFKELRNVKAPRLLPHLHMN